MDNIKALYEDAGRLHKRATDILDEYAGKDMPGEKQHEVDTLLDQVEAKTAEAKRAERVASIGRDLDAPATRLPSPVAPEAKTDDSAVEFKAAFGGFLRKGASRLSPAEFKALAANDDQAGGYLVPDTFNLTLLTKQREVSAMRRLARILPPIPGGSSITPTQDTDLTDATWTSEIATGSADTVKPFGQRVLTPHPLAKRIKVSNTLLRATSFDVEAWVRDNMAYKFAVPEENAFINGSGAQQPLGLLNTAGLVSYTTAAATTVTADDVINWVYSLPARYAANARILCNRAFVRKVRSLKDGGGNYVWQPGLQVGSPNAILDVPYEFSDRVNDALDAGDAWEANAYPAILGDFSYYWIVDSQGFSIQRVNELYAETNQVGFIGRKETDGMAIQAEAFVALKIKA